MAASQTPASAPVQKWLDTIRAYDQEFTKWTARTTKIVKKYRDDASFAASADQTAKFNILWSNVQTLVPAVYAKMPKADVSRRFGDDDPVGRVASLLIERALDYEIEHFPDFRSAVRYCVEDRFLGGRGVSWVRYEPHTRAQLEVTDAADDPQEADDLGNAAPTPDQTANASEPPEEIEYECSPTDYVHWKDFGHTVARTWEEVTGVWRWVYMAKSAVRDRFGKKVAEQLTYGSSPDKLDARQRAGRTNDKAKIAEIWDKEAGSVLWLCDGCPDLLDEVSDPLDLEGFFPCPKPLFATLTSDTLVPVPDFIFYQDQANELDILTDRIDGLVKALRIRGVYDASQPALQRLLTEGDNNTLIPVDKWGALAEKGGLKGSIDILPIVDIANALLQSYQAQANVKAQIYEITGISDIIRGATAASETATAQQIKGQYASLRLKSMQEGVALFASELLRLKAQVICSKFQPETILAHAAAQSMNQADQQLIPQAIQLLQSEPLRSFRIEVDADSLVQLDENQTKQDRVEFLNALANFLREALPAGQQTPELVPMLMQVMKFGIGGFKQARAIEGTIDVALQQLVAKAQQNAASPQASPEAQKLQADQQQHQAQLQADQQTAQIKARSDQAIEQMKAQAELQREQMKQQMEAQRAQANAQLKLQEIAQHAQIDKWKAELDASTKIMVARISAAAGADPQTIETVMSATQKLTDDLGKASEGLTQLHQGMADRHAQAMQGVGQAMDGVTQAVAAMKAPKRVIRGPDGRISGVESAPQPQGA